MKVIVTERFHDKYTLQEYYPGDELDITKERYGEILTVGNFVKKAPVKRKKQDEA